MSHLLRWAGQGASVLKKITLCFLAPVALMGYVFSVDKSWCKNRRSGLVQARKKCFIVVSCL